MLPCNFFGPPAHGDFLLDQQTDNGAYYCFCRPSQAPWNSSGTMSCNQILLEELGYLKSIGVPMGYLSFQGAGVSSFDRADDTAAPWCVSTWGVDPGGQDSEYPLSMGQFQQQLSQPRRHLRLL